IVGTGTSTDTDATGSSISPVAPVSKGSTKKGTAVTTGQGTAVTTGQGTAVITGQGTAVTTGSKGSKGSKRSENNKNININTDINITLGTPEAPFMPSQTNNLGNGRVQFIINIVINFITNTYWADPIAAVGYDYAIEHGPKITAVELPKGIGDNIYDLWVYNDQSNTYVDSNVDIEGGVLYKFNKPTSKFAIRGIETSAGLNPNSETAFPTGLRFEKTGKAVLSMTSVSAETK
ncbi:MAG: hypothetical protein WBM35_08290, partial [Candidatus Electrothrix sp.]